MKGDETFTGDVVFIPYGTEGPPYLGQLHRGPQHSNYLPGAGLTLVGVFLLGFGLRRGTQCWLVLAIFAVGTLAGVAGISACSGGSNGMTPGSYQYTITAGFSPGTTTVMTATSTNVSVTVP